MQRIQDFELTQFEYLEDKDQLLLREELQLGNTILYIIVVNFDHMKKELINMNVQTSANRTWAFFARRFSVFSTREDRQRWALEPGAEVGTGQESREDDRQRGHWNKS